MGVFNGTVEKIENTDNKVTTITADSTDIEYPTAKAVKNYADSKTAQALEAKYLEAIDCNTLLDNGSYMTRSDGWSNEPTGLSSDDKENGVLTVIAVNKPMNDDTTIQATKFKYLTVTQVFDCSGTARYERKTSGLLKKNSDASWEEVTAEINQMMSSEYTVSEVQEIFAGQSTLEDVTWQPCLVSTSGGGVQEHGTWTPVFQTSFIASLSTNNCTYTKLSETEVYINMHLVGVMGNSPSGGYLTRQFTGFPFPITNGKVNGLIGFSNDSNKTASKYSPWLYLSSGEKRLDFNSVPANFSFQAFFNGVITIG